VLASKGYPGKYETGKKIYGLEKIKQDNDLMLFHAGTEKIITENKTSYITSGGRVLNVVAKEQTLKAAIEKVYSAINELNFEGMYYRKDIGEKGLKYVNL
jgi:phosphoribosylamine--glycine ligase